MNLCIHCKHYQPNDMETLSGDPRYSLCIRKDRLSPVDGTPIRFYCDVERGSTGTCKPEGIHFIPAEG